MAVIDAGDNMSQIKWQPAYATGIERIDTQHRQLIKLINHLELSVERNDRDEIAGILKEIGSYVDEHFSYEEQLLEQSCYKFLDSHIRAHRRFSQRLDSLSQRFELGGYVTRELLNFLKRWLTSHIAIDDQSYVPCVVREGEQTCECESDSARAM